MDNNFVVSGNILTRYIGSDINVTLASGIQAIDEGAFRDCKLVESITLNKSVNFISDGAFLNCQSLKEIVLPDINFIGFMTFANCKALTKLVIPSSVSIIYEAGLCYCTSIPELIVPINVTRIDENAFYGWNSTQTIMLPSRFEDINFVNCHALCKYY